MASAFICAAAPLFTAKLKYFSSDEEHHANAWLNA
jgi:hypothetical protein